MNTLVANAGAKVAAGLNARLVRYALVLEAVDESMTKLMCPCPSSTMAAVVGGAASAPGAGINTGVTLNAPLLVP